MKNNLLLGFAVAGGKTENEYFEIIQFLKSIGCNTFELTLLDADEVLKFKNLNRLKEIAQGFECVSVHAPSKGINYDRSKDTKDKLDAIDKVIKVLNPHIVVLHSPSVSEPTIVNERNWPLGIENMDWRKDDARFSEELKIILENYPKAAVVLDMNHVYTHDKTMMLLKDLWTDFKSKVRHFHISGFVDERNYHEPFYQSNCDIVLESLPTLKLPLIIEVFITQLKHEEIKKEYQYVINKLEVD